VSVAISGQVVVEADYVRRLVDRDPETEQHFASHFGRLLRALVRVRRHGWPDERVEDAVQETFTRALSAVRGGGLRDADRFAAFLISICENVLREDARQVARVHPSESAALEQRAPHDPEAQANARQSLQAAREVLAAMPQRDREILEMVLVLEADKDEVCRRFGVTRDHLRVLLHRAKERFGKRMAGK
jgi:RNA polymerase sigma-70 factor, ECF subfamily